MRDEKALRDAFDLLNVVEEALAEAETPTVPNDEISEYQETVRRTVTRKVLEKVRTLAASNP